MHASCGMWLVGTAGEVHVATGTDVGVACASRSLKLPGGRTWIIGTLKLPNALAHLHDTSRETWCIAVSTCKVLLCADQLLSGAHPASITAMLCHAVLCWLDCVLQPLIQPGVQLVVANFPHNPTGTMLAQQDWRQLVAACEAAGAWLFSDEMYKFTGVCQVQLITSVLLVSSLCINFAIVFPL